MHIRTPRWFLGLLLPIAAMTYSTFPTGTDIQKGLDAKLNSVTGDWSGVASDQAFTLGFHLTEAPVGQVAGTGSMQERGTPGTEQLTVSGTHHRPDLALTFDGMVSHGHAVRGTFHGQCTTVAGVGDTLVMTGLNADIYVKRIYVLLQSP